LLEMTTCSLTRLPKQAIVLVETVKQHTRDIKRDL